MSNCLLDQASLSPDFSHDVCTTFNLQRRRYEGVQQCDLRACVCFNQVLVGNESVEFAGHEVIE